MKIKNGFDMQDVCGLHVIVATGLENMDFSKIVSLNDSAAVMWNAAHGHDFTEEDLVKALLNEYEVDEEQALADVRDTLKQWTEIGLIEQA